MLLDDKRKLLIDIAVKNIWNDLTDRRGIRQELEACDEEIQKEIQYMIKNEFEKIFMVIE